MPKVHLKQSFIENPPLPTNDKAKVQYFDDRIPGFILEVTRTGRATYYLRYRDKSNRIRQARLGSTDSLGLEQAREKARVMRSQAQMGFNPLEQLEKVKSTPTFKEFVREKYIPYIKSYKRSWEFDQQTIEKRMMRIWGHKKLNEFKPGDLIEFQNTMVNQGFKPGSVNRYMAIIKHILNTAEKWDYIDSSPTRKVSRMYDAGRQERFLSPEELERVLDELNNCNSPVVPDIIRFLIMTGARKSEAVNLPWSEVDLEAGEWVLPPERNKGKRFKRIPLSKKAVELLQNRQQNGCAYVFPNPETGKPIQHFHGTWDRIRKNAGVPDLRIHDIRHSFASFLVNSGRSLYEVQKLLSHSDISQTQRYAHLRKDTLQDAAEIVSKLL